MQLTTLFSIVAVGVGFAACSLAPTPSPILSLPYGRWQGVYDADFDAYTFRNVRFAAAPVGNLRFAKPAPPQPVEGIQDGSFGPQCIQGPTVPNLPPPSIPPGINPNLTFSKIPESEDCLFFDLNVPGKVIRKEVSKKLPVVVWLYGGAFVLGTKEIYDGKAIIQESQNDTIVIVPNYRVGVFGFLGGTSVEKQGGTPNLGLYDQRAVFQWVQDYIHLVDGDKDNVSAWGESAGAGSILHHLVLEGGKLDPLFHRAIVMSPGFEPRVDGSGSAEDNYQEFTTAAGCKGKGLACLRQLNTTYLASVNNQLSDIFWAPVPDGKLIPGPPALLLTSGNHWKALKSIIVTHVRNEGALFVPNPLPDDFVDTVVSAIFPPNSSDLVTKVLDAYNPGSPQFVASVNADLLIKCNARWLIEAYKGRAYLAQYSVGAATHGSDTAAAFADSKTFISPVPLFQAYASYFASHAVIGDPNSRRNKTNTITWPLVSNASLEQPGNTLNVTDDGFELIHDTEVSKRLCSVWRNAYITAQGRSTHAYLPRERNVSW